MCIMWLSLAAVTAIEACVKIKRCQIWDLENEVQVPSRPINDVSVSSVLPRHLDLCVIVMKTGISRGEKKGTRKDVMLNMIA